MARRSSKKNSPARYLHRDQRSADRRRPADLDTLESRKREGHLYRTTTSTIREPPAGTIVVTTVETYRRFQTLANDIWNAIDPLAPRFTPAWNPQFDAAAAFVIQARDAGLDPLLVDQYLKTPHLFDALAGVAPITLDHHDANKAALLHLTTAELACSVREEHGRWLVETGVGGTLKIHGSCTTKDEAIVVAQAIRDQAWITRVEEIRIARGGLLDWGAPVIMPYPVAVYPASPS